jgi:SPP1 gp7 family putative phage head morphogenesis protein
MSDILNDVKSSSSTNAVDSLYANMTESTFFKSPVVADSYMMPYNIDDLYQKTFDYSIYEKMTIDDQVNVCLQLKKDLILGDGAQIISSDEYQENMVKDIERALFCDYEGNFVDDLEEILTAYEYGFSITEKIFKHRDKNKLGLKVLKTRHPNSWLIYQDDKGNISKFEQRTVVGNLDVQKNTIIHFVNSKKFQNPYGTSDLRAAYNAWLTKTHIVRFFSIFLEKAASPIPVGKYNKNSPPGTADKLLEVLKRFQTKTAITIPEDIMVDFLEAKNNGEVYHKAIHLFNMFIGRSLFVPDLVGFTGSETSGGSFSLGKEQMNLFFMHIHRRRASLEDVINKEIILPIVNYNFGFVENPPKFKFKPLDDNKAVELAKVWLEAIKGNAYQANEDEINHFRKLVKFPTGDVVFKQPTSTFMPKPNQEIENEDDNKKEIQDKKVDEKENAEEKKEFSKDKFVGEYYKKVDFKVLKTKLDDYDNSVMKESESVVKKIFIDLFDQIQKKKILQSQNPEKIDTLTLKYKKELKQILNSSFYGLYKDSKKIAETEIKKSNFAKPLTEDKFLEMIETENYNFIGDWEYNVLKKTRVELISAIKDGKPISSVLNILDDELKKLTAVQLERYARTKHTEVMNNGRKEYFDSTGVVAGYQCSAIMDDRTTDICAALDGKIFKADDAPVFPLHFNCRSTLIPITIYEEFKPTESIKGMSPNQFIEENKGAGFSKYILEKQSENDTLEIKPEKKKIEITDSGVSFETIFLDEKTELIKYSFNNKVFKETTIVYKSNEKIDGEYLSINHKDV